MEKTINTTHSDSISTADALWSLIVKQKKSVQKELAQRLLALVQSDKKASQEAYVKETLENALAEVRDAQASGKELPDARFLFDEIGK